MTTPTQNLHKTKYEQRRKLDSNQQFHGIQGNKDIL